MMTPLNHHLLPRRMFLRAGVVSIGLPLLDAMLPCGIGADAKIAALRPRRLVLSGRCLGSIASNLFPKTQGLKYEKTRYLSLLEAHRGRFTVFSGVSHLDYPNSHHTEAGLFTAIRPDHIQRPEDIRPSISLDQVVVEKVGGETRIPNLALGRCNSPMVFNRRGVPIPGHQRPEEVFRTLFIDGTPQEVEREVRRLADGRSILDGMRDQLRLLEKSVGAADRARLEQLTASIRDAERQLLQDEAWVRKPKPKVNRTTDQLRDLSGAGALRQWYDLVFLAFQTDATRVAVVMEMEGETGFQSGAEIGAHDASHHGLEPRKLEQFARYEEASTRSLGEFLDKLHESTDGAGTLLDQTVVCWASNLGDPSAHASNNLPVLVAGGGFKHQGHIAFDGKRNYPLSNIYTRILRQVGIDTEKFGASTGVLEAIG